MVSAIGLNSALGIINSVAGILVKGKEISAESGKKINRATRLTQRAMNTTSSITALSGQTSIMARIFYDESIVDEAIIPNMAKAFHEWYAAQCIAALQLSQMVDGFRNVQEVLTVVQTGQNRRQRSIVDNIGASRFATESFIANYTGNDEIATEALNKITVTVSKNNKNFGGSPPVAPAPIHNPAINNEVSVRAITNKDRNVGPLGELFEVTLKNPKGDGNSSVTVPLFIQMQPSLIPAGIAPRFIDMNVAPTLWQRWTQMNAGEIHWFKDFVMQRDLAKRQRSVLKDPAKAEAYIDFLRTVAKKDKYALDDVSDSLNSSQSHNLANSVIVFSEETVIQAKSDSGIDLHNKRDRDRYFRDTYSMIIAIVDSLHQRVTIYFNGLDGSIDVPYNDFRPKDTRYDPKEFMAALQSFSSGSISRMR